MPGFIPPDRWRRHANRWSVYTRFAAIPAGIVAGWSRVWLDWWAALPIVLVILWLAINPFVFKPVVVPAHWIEKGVLGEQMWLQGRFAAADRWRVRVFLALGVVGMIVLIGGVVWLIPWAAIGGAGLVVVAQVARIRIYARLYDLQHAQR